MTNSPKAIPIAIASAVWVIGRLKSRIVRGLSRRCHRRSGRRTALDAGGELLSRGNTALRVIPFSDTRLEFPIGAGVRRRDRDLAAAVDNALEQLQGSSEAQAVLARYGAVAGSSASPASEATFPVPEQMSGEAGRSLFSSLCSRCHGSKGFGSGAGGAAPSIRHYEAGQEKFLRIVQGGKKGTAMGPFKGILTLEEILSIYQYVTSLPRQ